MSAPYQVMPDLPEADFDALKADIALRGVLVPVEKDEYGNVLDGHHRIRACEELGITDYPVIVRVGLGEPEKRLHARILNVLRRQLTDVERQEQARAMRADGASLRTIAEALGVSAATVLRDIRATVSNETVDPPSRIVGKDGKSRPASRPVSAFVSSPSEAQAVMEMVAEAPTAVDRLAGGFVTPKEVEKAVRREVRSIHREALTAALAETHPLLSDRATIFQSDIMGEEWRQHIAPGSVDAIVTDPPYPSEFLGCFDALGAFALEVLKPGGLLVCMSGQANLPEVLRRLCQFDGLDYLWTAAYLTPGGQAVQVWPRKVNTFWKPLLIFVKGEYTGDWYGDVTRSDTNDNDKRFHGWGQSESGIADVMARFTRPADLVCDPFTGGGTTAVVALETNRRFVGFDIDAGCVETTKGRVPQ